MPIPVPPLAQLAYDLHLARLSPNPVPSTTAHQQPPMDAPASPSQAGSSQSTTEPVPPLQRASVIAPMSHGLPPQLEPKHPLTLYMASLDAAIGPPAMFIPTLDLNSDRALRQFVWHAQNYAGWIERQRVVHEKLAKGVKFIDEGEKKLEVLRKEGVAKRHTIRITANALSSLQSGLPSTPEPVHSMTELQRRTIQDAISIRTASYAIAGQDYLITATNYRNLTARVIRARAVDTNDRVRFQETVDAIRGCGVEQAHLMGLMKEWKNAVGTAMGHAAAGTLKGAEVLAEDDGSQGAWAVDGSRGPLGHCAKKISQWFEGTYPGAFAEDGSWVGRGDSK